MVRRWALVLMCAGLAAGCGDDGPSSEILYQGPIPFERAGGSDRAHALQITIKADGIERKAVLDTGSIYYLLASPDNSDQLPCPAPETFTYGVGEAEFCPGDSHLAVENDGGTFPSLRSGPLRYGQAHFTNWAEPALGVLGLAGNLAVNPPGKNRPGMTPLVDQLFPAHLSFAFPGGWAEPGTLRFGPLPASSGTVLDVPLVDPGKLGYGYTARFARFEYIVDDAVHTTIETRSDGVYIVSGASSDKIADRFIAFFDTGTPVPLFAANGDFSLLGDAVPQGSLFPEADAPFYDSFNCVFTSDDGDELVLSSGDQTRWQKPGDAGLQARILTAAAVSKAFPNGMSLYAPVIGLPFLARYNLEFRFGLDHRATHARFLVRP